MQQQDVLNLIIDKLEVQQLLLCSMVSKVFLRAIDSSKKFINAPLITTQMPLQKFNL